MYRKILVPLDGSALSELALPHAEELTRRFNSEIILIRVCQAVAMPLELYPPLAGVTYDYYTELQIQTEKETKDYLLKLQKKLQQAGLKCRHLALEGYVPDAILEVAEKEAVDLIVMSTHGRSGLSRWVYGSVAAKVLQAAPCPVFLVRAKNHLEKD
jgi:nucleotide-binding universal stress UspA family protein